MADQEFQTIEIGDDQFKKKFEVNRAEWAALGPAEKEQTARQMMTAYLEKEPSFLDKTVQVGAGASNAALGMLDTAHDLTMGPINYLTDTIGGAALSGINHVAGTDYELPERRSFAQSAQDIGLVEPRDVRAPGYYDTGEIVGDSLGAILTMGAGASGVLAKQATKPVSTLAKPVEQVLNGAAKVAQNPVTVAAPAAIVDGTLEYQGRELGGELGRDIGENYGYGDLGEDIGSGVGAVAAPLSTAAVGGVGSRAVQSLASNPDAPRLAEIMRDNAITPNTIVLGNNMGKNLTKLTAAIPGSSGTAQGQQIRLAEELGDAVHRTADTAREVPLGQGKQYSRAYGDDDEGVSTGAIGETIARAATRAGDRLDGVLGGLTNKEFDALGGRKAAIPVQNAHDGIATRRGELSSLSHDTVDPLSNALSKDRMTPIDPQKHTALLAQQEQAATAMAKLTDQAAQGTPGANEQLRVLRAHAADLEDQILANLGVTAERLDDFRSGVGKATANGGRAADKTTAKGIYRDVRDAQRSVANANGNLPEFNAANAEKARLLNDKLPYAEGGDVPLMKTLSDSVNKPKAIYDRFFGKSGGQNTGQLVNLKRNMPEAEWNQLRGDFIDAMVLPNSANQRNTDMATNSFSPAQFITSWENLPARSKAVLFDESTIRQLDNLARIAAETGAYRGAGAGAANAGVAVPFGLAAGFFTKPAKTAAAVSGAALGGRAFLSEYFADIMSKEIPSYAARTARSVGVRGVKEAVGAEPREDGEWDRRRKQIEQGPQ